MSSTDDLDDILEGLSYEDLQAISDEIDPEVYIRSNSVSASLKHHV